MAELSSYSLREKRVVLTCLKRQKEPQITIAYERHSSFPFRQWFSTIRTQVLPTSWAQRHLERGTEKRELSSARAALLQEATCVPGASRQHMKAPDQGVMCGFLQTLRAVAQIRGWRPFQNGGKLNAWLRRISINACKQRDKFLSVSKLLFLALKV